MNNASRSKCRVIFYEGSSFGYGIVSYGCFPWSRGNFAGGFARRKLFVWFVTSETSGARHRARWNAKRFRITTPGVEIHFFQSKSRTVSVRAACGGGTRRENGERKWETKRERESPHMKPLSAPIQQYFYIYYPPPPLLFVRYPSTAIPLNLKPAT